MTKKLLFITCLVFAFLSCNDFHRNKSHAEVTDESIARGQQLSAVYCASCHQLPDPSLLDAKSWETGVLPHMGPRLGIYEYKLQKYPALLGDRNLPPGYYPAHASVTPDEWQHILDFYTATAPDNLTAGSFSPPVIRETPLFQAQKLEAFYPSPATSFVRIDPASRQLIVTDLQKQNVVWYDATLHAVDSLHLFGRIVDITTAGDSLIACNIGSFAPTNERYGKAQLITRGSSGRMQDAGLPCLQALQRPVHIEQTDLDRDGRADLLVCEFGYLSGSLSWYRNEGDGHWKKEVLRAQPGAIRTYVNDYNQDGLPDVWALFAQGEEGVFLFTNKGKGRFEEKQVLRFPPSYGSSGFELTDFNKDGFPDIVYTCGDNADYSSILKPYHGVYIFLNDGSNHFTQQFFYAINGCYKSLARDFDGDGDLDLACIAYFADYEINPGEGFIYLENQGDYHFEHSTAMGSTTGRWMTMDAGDLNGDGKTDLVLGNFSIGPVMKKSARDWEKGPPFLLMRNTGKKQ